MNTETIMGSATPAVNAVVDDAPYLLPTYAALMMAHGGGFDLEATTPTKLEQQIKRYIAEYTPEYPSDTEFNARVLAAVQRRDFVPYGKGAVRARWPHEESMIIN